MQRTAARPWPHIHVQLQAAVLVVVCRLVCPRACCRVADAGSRIIRLCRSLVHHLLRRRSRSTGRAYMRFLWQAHMDVLGAAKANLSTAVVAFFHRSIMRPNPAVNTDARRRGFAQAGVAGYLTR
jgi:hypothetical protein